MSKDNGASVPDQALVQAPSPDGLGPTGFDPSRCPWCGQDGIVIHPLPPETRGLNMLRSRAPYYGHCDGCGADGPPGDTEIEAETNWNVRAPVGVDLSLIEAAYEALGNMMMQRRFSETEQQRANVKHAIATFNRLNAAQAIETRSAKTEGLGPKDESAVGSADAPKASPDPRDDGEK